MANIKFSGFTANGTIDGGLVPAPSGSETSFLVGFDSTTPTNNYWTFEQVKAGLAAAPGTAFSIYAADGTITSARTVTMGTYNLAFASTTAGQEVSFGQNVKISGQGYTEQHDQTDLTISWNNSNVVYATLTTGTILFDPSDAKSGATYILYLRQPASGGPTLINWNSLVLWPGGTPPTLSTAAGATDVITLIYNGTSTKYFGTSVLNFS